MRRASLVVFVTVLLGLAVPALAFAGNGNGNGPKDTRDVGKDVHYGKKKVVPPTPAQQAAIQATATATTGTTPPVGTQRTWLILDDAFGRYRLATFTLKEVADKNEIWVQNNLSFPTGDCRNDGSRNVITQDQVDYLAGQFEGNMFPKESATFSVPPGRDGSHATLPALLGLPSNYYEGESDNIVILISNVRDTNYYDTNNAHGFSYIAGFFSSQLNTFFDRNVMTVDAFDWLHRTGANPPNEPVAGDNCMEPEREAQRLLKTAWGNKFPVDPVQIARSLGADVVELELEAGVAGAIYKNAGEDPTIILNDADSPNRKRFTAAHELGHLVMHAGDQEIDYIDHRHALDSEVERGWAEDFADKFASALLMPEDEVKRLKRDHATASQIALYFGVSHDAVYFRLKDLGFSSSQG